MPIFKLCAPTTMRLFSGHILSRNASNFTRIHLDFKHFPGGETTGLLILGQGRESEVMGKIKGFLCGKEGKEWKGREGREGWEGKRGASGRGDLAPRS